MTDYTLPTAMLARLFADAAEAEALRHGALQAAETMTALQTQIHDLSQERLRESERATAAEQSLARTLTMLDEVRKQRDEASSDLTAARDEQHQTALDLENMTTARDTLAAELAKRLVPTPDPIDAAHPLQPGERVRLIDAGAAIGEGQDHGYAPGLEVGALGTVDRLSDDRTVFVTWDARGLGTRALFTMVHRLERA